MLKHGKTASSLVSVSNKKGLFSALDVVVANVWLSTALFLAGESFQQHPAVIGGVHHGAAGVCQQHGHHAAHQNREQPAHDQHDIGDQQTALVTAARSAICALNTKGGCNARCAMFPGATGVAPENAGAGAGLSASSGATIKGL